ncbi:MAG: hypothetical protein ACYTFY_16960, partial [Planctomycetota bacterium]
QKNNCDSDLLNKYIETAKSIIPEIIVPGGAAIGFSRVPSDYEGIFSIPYQGLYISWSDGRRSLYEIIMRTAAEAGNTAM